MPFPFNCCCVAKSSRSDVYRAAPGGKAADQPSDHPAAGPLEASGFHAIPACTIQDCTSGGETDSASDATAQPLKYSWDKRRAAGIDASKYQVANVDGEFILRDDINGQQLTVENCKRSVISVLDVTGSVVIDDCVECTFVVGPCNGSLFIRNSSNCRLFYVGQQFRLRDCKDLDIAIHCRTQPIIESAAAIRFYRLNMNYPALHDQLMTMGLTAFGEGTRSVHDYTPSGGANRNYSIHDEPFRMSLASERELSRLGKVNIEPEESVFIVRCEKGRYIKDEKRNLILALQRTYEAHKDFYISAYDATKRALEKGLTIANVSEAVVDEDLGELLKDEFAAQIGNHFILLDVAGDNDAVTDLLEGDGGRAFRRVPVRYAHLLRERIFS